MFKTAEEACRELFVVTGTLEFMHIAMRQTFSQIFGKDMEEETAGILLKCIEEKLPAILEAIVPLYAGEFSLDELNQIVAFYKTNLGKKLVIKMPQLLQLQQPLIARAMEEIAEDFKKKLH